MSGPLVRAILEGKKTVTRRPLKPQPEHTLRETIPATGGLPEGGWYDWRWRGGWLHPDRCPYGGRGDRLWVKETWIAERSLDAIRPSQLPHDHRGALFPFWYAAAIVRAQFAERQAEEVAA